MSSKFCLLAFLSAVLPTLCAAADKTAVPSPAAALVKDALAADAKDSSQREVLLREAIRRDPDFELAHWLLGEVYFQGIWRSVDSIGQLTSRDPRWQDYRERLTTIDGTPAAHAGLARWCREHNLENEAKWHWYQVLQADPKNREALGNLGVKHFEDGYYTTEQIEQSKKARAQAEQDFKRFRREFKSLVSSAERAKGDGQVKLLAKLAAVHDPAAVEALMDALVDASDDARESGFGEKVGRAVVTALSGIDKHPATLKLVEIALYSPHASVRHSAAEGLRYREPTDFVPLLMASLTAPLECTYSIRVAPTGHVNLIENVYEIGPEVEHSHTQTNSLLTRYMVRTQYQRPDGKIIEGLEPRLNPAGDIRKAQARANSTLQLVAAENAARNNRNQRIQNVLEISTHKQLGNDPKAWWTYWQEYNELYTPEELPVNNSSSEYVYTATQMPMSCFVAGTPVWTQSGPKAIEQITVGELVLSQEPHSGRLEYRPVIGTTIRPETAVLELGIGEEKIVTTRGHRFWVAGEGWRMAKHLNPGATLVSAGGSSRLSEIREAEDEIAYNLMVGEFHTYFVGASRLLVHDNNCPVPTTAAVPGSNRE